MKKLENLYEEYNKLKDKALKNKSLNLLEDYKNKLIELDYAINLDYESHLETDFPMTTTLDKEEERLEKLISYIEDTSREQKNLISDYKKVTGEVMELSYLKYTDNLKPYKERLSNVRKILSIIEDIKSNKSESKVKVLKNKLLKKDLLSLLYEFCLIDSLDTEEIDVSKLIKNNDLNEEITSVKEESEIVEIFEEEVTNNTSIKNDDVVEESIQNSKINHELIENVEFPKEEDKGNILTTMPIVDKIGSVVPVNVFESLQKAEEKLPDVVLPSNGLKDDENDIFVETKDLFEPEKKIK